MTNAKIHIKLGPLEVNCEASEEFISVHLFNIMEAISQLEVQDVGGPAALGEQSGNIDTEHANRTKLSTTDFAVKMGVKSGSDLVMAAAAHLHHTLGQEEFRRGDILSHMKSAKAFYRTSYGSNLSKSLDMLVKSGRLGNPRPDHYALPYSEIESNKNLL